MPKDKPEPGAPEATEPDDAPAPLETVEFTWNDETWSVLADVDEWPFTVTEALETGRVTVFVRGILGRTQMERFLTGSRCKTGDAAELQEAVLAAVKAKSRGE